jgi:cytochrome c biogenesis protein CcdA/thiol-disulfide isomerase/thioredoxin
VWCTRITAVLGLLAVGVVAGLIAGISPCIVPVLPVVLVAGATGEGTADEIIRSGRRRAVGIVAGLVVSFSAVTLGGSWLLGALHLPQDLLRDLGLVVLGVFGLGLLVPRLGEMLERPFARLAPRRAPSRRRGAFVLGLGLGAVFVPCAGPVLAAISVIGATHHVGFESVLLTVCFAVGASVPLFFVALAGDELVARVGQLRRRGPVLRRAGGLVLVAMALVIGFNLTDGLQRLVPGYTSTLQHDVEGTSFATSQLQALTGNGSGSFTACEGPGLHSCGAAPAIRGITAWLNTPDGRPLSLAALKGKVVLVDFWTYSCINCQRTLPHVEAWYSRYHGDGFEVIGVHTPEFAFEHVVSNVRAASQALGVAYPVAVDDGYKTWNAYHNEYWPAEYLIDSSGVVRHVHFAESDYPQTESLIRHLLVDADPKVSLPRPTDLPDRTPDEPTNPETYLGYERAQYDVGAGLIPDTPTAYSFPASLPPGGYALSGVWTVGGESATAGNAAALELGFQAKAIYLVLGGSGTVRVSVNGTLTKTITVNGVPDLYTLLDAPQLQTGTLLLHFTPGVAAYDFTFG